MRGKNKKKGYTLLELIIALALSVLVITTVSLIYTATSNYYGKDNRIASGEEQELESVYALVEGYCRQAEKEGFEVVLEQPTEGGYLCLKSVRTSDNYIRSLQFDTLNKSMENGDTVYRMESITGIVFSLSENNKLLKTEVSYTCNDVAYKQSFVFLLRTGRITQTDGV